MRPPNAAGTACPFASRDSYETRYSWSLASSSSPGGTWRACHRVDLRAADFAPGAGAARRADRQLHLLRLRRPERRHLRRQLHHAAAERVLREQDRAESAVVVRVEFRPGGLPLGNSARRVVADEPDAPRNSGGPPRSQALSRALCPRRRMREGEAASRRRFGQLDLQAAYRGNVADAGIRRVTDEQAAVGAQACLNPFPIHGSVTVVAEAAARGDAEAHPGRGGLVRGGRQGAMTTDDENGAAGRSLAVSRINERAGRS